MIEYCQVQPDDKGKDKVIVIDGVNRLFGASSFIEIFNKLGRDNWKMCGQTLDYSYTDKDEAGVSEQYFSVFYFMREVKE